jgi:hypothetical protein
MNVSYSGLDALCTILPLPRFEMLRLVPLFDRLADRRSSQRYATPGLRIAIRWWAEGAAIESAAALLNVGEGGALLLVDHPPPLHQNIRISLERKAGGADYIDARVMCLGGFYKVAVSFRDLSPAQFLVLTRA